MHLFESKARNSWLQAKNEPEIDVTWQDALSMSYGEYC